MAETTTAAKTTRPARARTAAKPAAAKTSAAKVAPAEVADDAGKARFTVTLEAQGETKSYAVFTPPEGSGCVGKFYAPLGTEIVKVLLIGPADSE